MAAIQENGPEIPGLLEGAGARTMPIPHDLAATIHVATDIQAAPKEQPQRKAPCRPALMRMAPKTMRESLYYWRYHTRHDDWHSLFESAELALCPGISMYNLIPGDVISGSIAFAGLYEWHLSKRFVALARAGGLLVDVGANMGYFSLLWAGLNPRSRTIAFEASPRNVRLLKQNIAANELQSRVTVIPKAAGLRRGTISFDAGPPEQTGWGGIAAQHTATTIEMPMVRLDEELPGADIDLLKVDVEGADTWVLFGCERLLEAGRIRTIFFEQNERMQQLGIAAGEAEAFLRKFGYTVSALGDGEWLARAPGH